MIQRVRPHVSPLDVLRGLFSLAVLTVLLVGVPVGLYAVAGSPLPDHVPSWQEVAGLLGRQYDDTLFIRIILLVAWGAWATFAASVILELAAKLRGRASATRLPGLGFVQRLAAYLLTSIGLALGGPVAAFAATPPPPAVVATTTTVNAVEAEPATQRSLRAEHPHEYRTHTVRSGECLWIIAEQQLGKGERYREIFALNRGRVMADGVAFRNPHLIHPGWKLRVPVTAHREPAEPLPAHPETGRLPELHPGHHSTSPDFSVPHPSAQPQQKRPATRQDLDPTPLATSTPTAAEPQRHEPGTAREPAPDARAGSAGPSTPTEITLAGDTQSVDGVPVAVVAPSIAGGMVLGSVLTLGALRHTQRQHRRRGRRIPLPADPATVRAEQNLRYLAGTTRQVRLQDALTQLAPFLNDRSVQVLGLELATTSVDVLLGAPAPARLPLRDAGTLTAPRWRLRLPAQPTELADAGDLMPALLSAGHTNNGDGTIFLNLEDLQVTTCHGPEPLVHTLLATAATDLAVSPHSGWFDLLTVGMEELTPVQGRVTNCRSLDEAINILAERVGELTDRTPDSRLDARALRRSEPGGDWALTVLVSRHQPTSAQVEHLLGLTRRVTGGTAVLLPADSASTPTPGQLILHHADQGELLMDIAPLGLTVIPHTLTLDTYEQLGQMFTTAGDLSDVSADQPPYRDLPHPPEPPSVSFTCDDEPAAVSPKASPDPSQADHPAPGPTKVIDVGILGPLAVTGAADHLQPKMQEALVALALAGKSGITGERLCYLLGTSPDRSKPHNQLRIYMSKIRRQLGPTGTGGKHIDWNQSKGTYFLRDVRLDWDRFRELTARGARASDTTLLWQAIDLVRGPLLDGSYFWWLEPAQEEEIRAEIVDAADLLAELELDAEHASLAGKAARAGLTADPTAEQLWRALMRAYYLAGNLSGVETVWKALLNVIEEVSIDGEPHPNTMALYYELTGRSRPPHSALKEAGSSPRFDPDMFDHDDLAEQRHA